MSDRTVSRAGWTLLCRELARRPAVLARLASWSVMESLPALVSGSVVAAAVDRGFLAHRPVTGLAWLGVLGLSIVVQAVARRGTFPWLAELVEPLRDTLVRTVVAAALDRAVADRRHLDATAVAQVSGQIELVRALVSALLRTLRPTLISILLALVGLATLAPVLAVITVPPVVTSLVLFGCSMRMLAARERARVLAEETVARTSAEVFGAVRDIVACGAEQRAGRAVMSAVSDEAGAAVGLARASSTRAAIVAIGGHLPLVLIVVLAPALTRTGAVTAGELVGAVTYLTATLVPALRSLVGAVGTWGRQLGVLMHRIAETSRRAERPPRPAGRRPAGADLRLVGVTFAYGPYAEPVVRDLSLDVPEGDHLAVVGPSGIGKSTLASLVTGLLRPQNGAILLGGVPVDEVGEEHLRRDVALIPQEAYVFAGTLRENLTYLRPDATLGELDAAVDAVGMRLLLSRLGGYDARVGTGGASLSAGERQLIALARVYVSPARVVVLDEAACHLDPRAEAQVDRAFAATGRTVIVIAHRISSARRAKRILFLDGTNALVGSHAGLLRDAKGYAELVGEWARPADRAPAEQAKA